MSGTFKDKPTKIKYKDKWPFNENEEQSPKKRKEKNTEWLWWKSTPSWWVKDHMNKPLRAFGRNLERSAVKQVDLERLQELDERGTGRKPFRYYW